MFLEYEKPKLRNIFNSVSEVQTVNDIYTKTNTSFYT